jgi:hypothetical protein
VSTIVSRLNLSYFTKKSAISLILPIILKLSFALVELSTKQTYLSYQKFPKSERGKEVLYFVTYKYLSAIADNTVAHRPVARQLTRNKQRYAKTMEVLLETIFSMW